MISKEKFQQILLDPRVATYLTQVGVDMLALIDLADILYEDISKEHGGLNFATFVDAVLNMRGANAVTVDDVKKQLRFTKRLIGQSQHKLETKIDKQFAKCSRQIKSLRRVVMGEDDDGEESSESSSADAMYVS